jgi:hypothetical protein
MGGVLVIPIGMLPAGAPASLPAKMPALPGIDTQAAAARARALVMEIERNLGYEPVDREFERKLRFIEVKGRIASAETITVTKNEILYSLNKPDDYILAMVEFHGDGERVYYLRRPFRREPDFDVTSVNYDFAALLARAGEPI